MKPDERHEGLWYRATRDSLRDLDISEQERSRLWSYLNNAVAEAFQEGRESMFSAEISEVTD